jgi:hypothetical protein
LARHSAGNAEDALRDLGVAIHKDRNLVQGLVETLIEQVMDCEVAPSHGVFGDGSESDVMEAEEVEHNYEELLSSGRSLQTTTNQTTSNVTIARYRSTLQKLIRNSNRRARAQSTVLANLTAQFASLRNLTLSSQGLVIGFGGNASSSIEVNTATTVVDAVQRRVGAAAASLPSMRIVVGAFSTDVNNVLTTVQSQTNVLSSALVSASQINDNIIEIQTSLSSMELADTASTNKFTTVENKVNANTNTINNMLSTVTTMSDAIDSLEEDASANTAKLICVHSPASAGEFTISGCNVRVMNGVGSTDLVNGKGNLIIGMNEDGSCGDTESGSCLRSGSHNLVLGLHNQYQSFAGIVAGTQNEVAGNYSTVTSGFKNKATSLYASVSGGGEGGAVTAEAVSVSGGLGNFANAHGATVSGGSLGLARADLSTIAGGLREISFTREAVVP